MVPIVDAWIERIAGWIDRRPGRFLLVAGGINVMFVAAFGAIAAFPADGPDGIDLQISLTAAAFQQIVTYWREAGISIERFRWTVGLLDLFFPIAYSTFLCGVYQLVCRGALLEPRRLVLLAPFAAVVADYVENALMVWLLGQRLPSGVLVFVMSGAAFIKFGLLTATTAFIVAAIIKGDAWRVLKIARYTVLSLLVGTLPLILLPQGRDLLTSLSHPAAFWHRMWFVVWLMVWALGTWYWSRVLLDAEADRGQSPEFKAWSSWLPRVIGAATLIVPALAILGGVRQSANPIAMVILGLSCLALGVAFLFYVLRRRERLADKEYRAAEKFSHDAVKWPSRALLGGSLVASGVLFIWFTAAPQSAGLVFGAVAILAIVAANTVFFGSIVVFLTEARRLPIEVVALACAATFSLWNDNHNVVLDGQMPRRETLVNDFTSWKANVPLDGNQRPVVIATGEGGGIRAAYWTAAVLHYLDNDSDPRLREMQVAKRLYAISSVSGSSFGAAVYAGLKKDSPGASGQLAVASSVLQRQFLAPMIAKLVTGDVAQWFLPFPFQPFDRSTALEEGFARAYAERVPGAKDTMNDPFTSFARNRPASLPVLFFNGTSVQSGRRIITSGVEWTAAGSETDDADPIDFHTLVGADVNLARAAHNTARFPYISPGGRLRTAQGTFAGHIVDGGYFENLGADTALDVITRLDHAKLTTDVRFVVIALTNSLRPKVSPTRVAWLEAPQLGEVFSPFRALLQTREARGTMALNRLRARVGEDNLVEFRVCDDEDDDRESRDAPLGWQLSAEMVAELNNQFVLKCFHKNVEDLAKALRRPAPTP